MSCPIYIFEDSNVDLLRPLTWARPAYDLRCGIFTLRDKIERAFPGRDVLLHCRQYLRQVLAEQNPGKHPSSTPERCLFINGRVLVNEEILSGFEAANDHLFVQEDQLVAAVLTGKNVKLALESELLNMQLFPSVNRTDVQVRLITYPWHLIENNAAEIAGDFKKLTTKGETRGDVSPQAVLTNREQIFIGEGSIVKPGVVLDAEQGPVYIGRNVTIMPNAVIEGPAFIGEHSVVKIGAKIYAGTSIGPVCKVGGEIEASILHSHSNKQHDGFLGHSYLGQWVNLGADTNTSDLKNNYSSVKLFVDEQLIDSGSQFVGLFMADHSKTGINTMFNTGTIVGVMSNIFGSGFPAKFVPSFSWGGSENFQEHDLGKALETARLVMARRGVKMTSAYEEMMRTIFSVTKEERTKLIKK